ncbi:MAG: hypothetical protein IT330_07430 [Anaerolineae bacterium]|nr:hypothetical protein [Anaerolineae bacterium]
MAKAHIDKTLTALAGEFLVAGHLCLRGYVASLTLKNYPAVDIFCLNPRNGKQVAIQVKTKRGGTQYFIPESISKVQNPFVFVFIKSAESVEFFIVPSQQVAKLSIAERDGYINTHPHVKKEQLLMLNVKTLAPFKDRWELLGLE